MLTVKLVTVSLKWAKIGLRAMEVRRFSSRAVTRYFCWIFQKMKSTGIQATMMNGVARLAMAIPTIVVMSWSESPAHW